MCLYTLARTHTRSQIFRNLLGARYKSRGLRRTKGDQCGSSAASNGKNRVIDPLPGPLPGPSERLRHDRFFPFSYIPFFRTVAAKVRESARERRRNLATRTYPATRAVTVNVKQRCICSSRFVFDRALKTPRLRNSREEWVSLNTGTDCRVFQSVITERQHSRGEIEQSPDGNATR